MNRRNFLNSLIGGVAVGAAARTWPFRVFSFPAEVKPFDWYASTSVPIAPTTIRIVRAYDPPVVGIPPSETVLFVDREVISAEQMYRYFVASQIEMINATHPSNS